MAVGAAVGLGAVSAAGALAQSSSQNRSIRTANASALQANAANAAYLDQRNAVEQSQLARKYAKFVASEAVLSSAKGTYGSASQVAAELSSMANALQDSAILSGNTRAEKNANNASTRNQIIQNNSQYQNPFLSTLSAGIQGAMSGYSLGSSIAYNPAAIRQAAAVRSTGIGVGFGYGSFFGSPFR